MRFADFQKKLRAEIMPSGDELAHLAQQRLGADKARVEENFNKYLKELLSLEFQIYKEYERKCSAEIIRRAVDEGLLRDTGRLSESTELNSNELFTFFLSISQSRKTRAGGSFEKHVRYLFELLGYPFDRQKVLDGKVDYVIPNAQAFRRNRTACVVISVKRTLRERWRQVIGELSSTNAGKIYILTADERVSRAKVEEMKSHNINLVVWDDYKSGKFGDSYNVLGFTSFVRVHLPSSRELWQKLL